ncbi:uncharacterized protein LOC130048270 [Ostrea edulis]|uniref:uncharacterized protein LOC130048270 n=1 Tax=Ostrea edulis TaxID=37623 RepID=UPI0024AFCBF8|nr:uncharacterized protein LOC130048270 [Ostrea edulis]
MRKVANLGLKTTYEERQAVHRLIKKLLALPYLPSGHIQGAFDNLRQLANTPALRELFQYVQDTWLDSDVWGIRQWSVFWLTVRTNNDVEGWHRRMIGRAGKAKLQFYVLVPLLMKEANQLSIIMRLVDEQQLTRYQRTTYRRIHGALFELWSEYEENTITTSLFLRKVGQIIAPAVPRPEQ